MRRHIREVCDSIMVSLRTNTKCKCAHAMYFATQSKYLRRAEEALNCMESRDWQQKNSRCIEAWLLSNAATNKTINTCGVLVLSRYLSCDLIMSLAFI
jgi:hypothetical protein